MNREKENVVIILLTLLIIITRVPFSRAESHNFSFGQLEVKIEAPLEVREGSQFSINVNILTLGELQFTHQILTDLNLQGGIKITFYSTDAYGGNYKVLRTEYITSPSLFAGNQEITKGFSTIAEKAGTQYWVRIDAAYICGVWVTNKTFDGLYIVCGRDDVGYNPNIHASVSYGGKYVPVEQGISGMKDSGSFLCTMSVKLTSDDVAVLQQQYATLHDQYQARVDENTRLSNDNMNLSRTVQLLEGLIFMLLVAVVISIGLFISERTKRREQLGKLIPQTPPQPLSQAYCPNCGNPVRQGDKFCRFCGKNL
jgi:hypothetical protein